MGLCFQELILLPVVCSIILVAAFVHILSYIRTPLPVLAAAAMADESAETVSPLIEKAARPAGKGDGEDDDDVDVEKGGAATASAEDLAARTVIGATSSNAADSEVHVSPVPNIPSAHMSAVAIALKFILIVAVIAITGAKLAYYDASSIGASDIVSSGFVIATLVAMAANHAIDLRIIRATGVPAVHLARSLSYLVLLVVLGFHLRTIIVMDKDQSLFSGSNAVVGALNIAQLAGLFLVFFADLKTVAWSNYPFDEVLKKGLQTSPESSANLISRLLFLWVTPIFRVGNHHLITMSELWWLPPSMTTTITTEILKSYIRGGSKTKASGTKPRGVMTAILVWYKWSLLGATFLQLIIAGLSFLTPTIIGYVVQFVADSARANAHPERNLTPPSLGYGLSLAFGLLLINFASLLMQSQVFHAVMSIAVNIQAALRGVLFEKVLRLPVHAQGSVSGKVVNHVATDSMAVSNVFFQAQSLPIVPIQIIVSIALLYGHLGPAVFASLGVVILFSPLFGWTANLSMKYSRTKLGFMDKRVKLTTEILQSIRTIKLNALGRVFLGRVQTIRDSELGELRKSNMLSALNSSITVFVPAFASFMAFLLATVLGRTISTAELFVCLSLFQILQNSVSSLSNLLPTIMSTAASYQRIRDFLELPEHKPYVIRGPKPAPGSDTPAVRLSGTKLAWKEFASDDDKAPTPGAKGGKPDTKAKATDDKKPAAGPPAPPVVSLTIDELAIKSGEHIIVQGVVGSGKSCLMSAILDQCHLVEGEVHVNGSVALVPQEAWLMNGMLRENILFGLPMDEERYAQVIFACALLPDLKMLPDGDLTLIGERGINLSGGQKARVVLARGIYANRDIYLIDDTLAALDAHVVRHVMQYAIQDMLAGKTIISVTHQRNYFHKYDGVLELHEGKIKSFTRHVNHATATVDGTSSSTAASTSDTASDDVAAADESAPNRSGSIEEVRVVLASTRDRKGDKVEEEILSAEGVGLGAYLEYLKFCGLGGVFLQVLLLVANQGANIAQQYWLGYWSRQSDGSSNLGFYFGIYGAIVVAYALLVIGQYINATAVLGIRAARKMNRTLLSRVLAFPMTFFDLTPVGRIINRFSSDQNVVDQMIPNLLNALCQLSFGVIFALISVAVSSPWFLLLVIPILGAMVLIARWYLKTSKQVSKLMSVSRSPVYALFGETASGRGSILGMNASTTFQAWMLIRLDAASRVWYSNMALNRWQSAWLQMIGVLITFSCIFLSVLTPGSEVLTGVSINMSLSVTQQLMFLVRMYVWLENQIISVERIREYRDMPVEDDPEGKLTVEKGEIQFDHYSARYSAKHKTDDETSKKAPSSSETDSGEQVPTKAAEAGADDSEGEESVDDPSLPPLVLRDLTLTIPAGQSVGLVGRTGSGKSTTAAALFRLLNAASGRILIDGVDISTVHLDDLRSQLTIISQDPVLFEGTLRSNLDPMGVHTDADMWATLDNVSMSLANEVRAHEMQLDMPISANGMSLGQRQLVCMTAALLRKTKVYVLDEASASIDLETEAALQKCLREQLMVGRTVIIIAHRIHTIVDCDRIMVLDKGRVVEDGAPRELAQQESSQFRALVEDAGLLVKLLGGEL
ncbi:hypothetical protein BC828DRAFT_395107 [Blastocladiella britannica]|nr:hypothetical protein BC828DRAFT_395107 [Blastocladiella britannica]